MGIERIFKRREKAPVVKIEPTAAPIGAEYDTRRAERRAARAERRAQRAVAPAAEPGQADTKIALRGNTPKANTANISEHEAQRFDKMTYRERLNLFNSNPQQYHKLSEGAKK
jgi:hypothetical protein